MIDYKSKDTYKQYRSREPETLLEAALAGIGFLGVLGGMVALLGMLEILLVQG